jgi:DNA-directed RNA polymerase subunit RPC12/RpoP
MPNWKGSSKPKKTTVGNCPECGHNKSEKLILDERFCECMKCGNIFPSKKHPNIENLARHWGQ